MARVSFRSVEGEEKTYKLIPHRSLKIGRDPANDIVLRDAKVSRVHAEIVYEKGFFVVHDLASANGTFINGRRIRVAPLTDGAELKLGNSFLTFSEEIQTAQPPTAGSAVERVESDAAAAAQPSHELSPADLGHELASTTPQPIPNPLLRSRPSFPSQEPQTIPAPLEKFPTDPSIRPTLTPDTPHQSARATKRSTDEHPTPVVERVPLSFPTAEEHPTPVDERLPTTTPAPLPRGGAPKRIDERLHHRTYRIERAPYGEVASIRDERGQGLFWFRRQGSAIRLVASVLALMILLSGVAAALLLAVQYRFVPAGGALLLTLIFAAVIFALAPKRFVVLYSSEALTGKSLSVIQENRLTFPKVRYSIRSEDGTTIARCEKNALRGLGLARQRWWILDRTTSAAIGYADEQSLGTAWARKLVGIFVSIHAAWNITVGDKNVGSIQPQDGAVVLDVSSDPAFTLDRRTALGIALMLEG